MFNSRKHNYVHGPLMTGYEIDRSELFAVKDRRRKLPKESAPFAQRKQANQNYTNMCTFYQFAEVLENKVYRETGIWYSVTEDELKRLWNIAKKKGLAGDKWGAYVNSPLIICQEESIRLIRKGTTEQIEVRVDQFFNVTSKNKSIEEYIKEVKMEIAYGGGCLSGINSRQTSLDYYEADDIPFTLEYSDGNSEISHATCLAAYNNRPGETGWSAYYPEKHTIAMPGTWGENFGKSGVVFIRDKDIKELFVPIGFTITID